MHSAKLPPFCKGYSDLNREFLGSPPIPQAWQRLNRSSETELGHEAMLRQPQTARNFSQNRGTLLRHRENTVYFAEATIAAVAKRYILQGSHLGESVKAPPLSEFLLPEPGVCGLLQQAVLEPDSPLEQCQWSPKPLVGGGGGCGIDLGSPILGLIFCEV